METLQSVHFRPSRSLPLSLCIFCQIHFDLCLGRMCLVFLGLSVVQVMFANGSSILLKMFPPHQKWLSGCLLLSSGYYSNIGKKERPPSLPPRPPSHHFTAGKSCHTLCHHKSGNCTLQAYLLKCIPCEGSNVYKVYSPSRHKTWDV